MPKLSSEVVNSMVGIQVHRMVNLGGPVSFVAEGYGVVESTEMIGGVEHKVFEVKPINE